MTQRHGMITIPFRQHATMTAAICTALLLGLALLFPCAPQAHAEDSPTQCQAGVENYIRNTPWTNDLFDLDALHRNYTGEGVTVAVIDSGISPNNPHLKDAVVEGTSFVPNDSSKGLHDVYAHGTIVAGIIGARRIPNSAVVGIAPGVRLMPIRVFEALREENGQTVGNANLYTLADAIRYAVDHGAKVINLSMSDTHDIPQMREAVEYASSHGALVVASAGNRLTSASTVDGMRYPAAYPQVLGVSAVNPNLAASDDAVHGAQVDVAAPGDNIASTVPFGVDCAFSGASNTSYATAYVSGQAALIAARYPQETPAQWKQRILVTANRAHPDRRDDRYGWGIIDPAASLQVVLAGNLRGPDLNGESTPPRMQQSQDGIVLAPQTDPNAQAKRVAMILIIVTAMVCAFSWLHTLRKT